jgi:hypothetical protein
MKVWVLKYLEYGSISVFAENTDILEVDAVKDELSYLEGGYEDERDDFIASVSNARKRGYGSAEIEERLSVELVEVR